MAKLVSTKTVVSYREKPSTKRPGIHAKTKTSKNKNNKNYIKPYKGQGR